MRYIVCYSGDELLMPIIEGNSGTQIFAPKGVNIEEFDSRELAENFIKSKLKIK